MTFPMRSQWRLVTDAHNRALAFIHRHLTAEARAKEIEPLLDALALLDAGVNLAVQGNLAEAIDAYAEAQRLESRVTVSAQVRNTLCLYGALWGSAEKVMEACEEAVALAPDLMWTRLSRGIARALTDDAEGAIVDLEAWVARTQDERARSETQGWIDALRGGRNPFTPAVLQDLRKR